MVRQMEADGAQGYDFVAYHGYGKRRYFELVDRKSKCATVVLSHLPLSPSLVSAECNVDFA